MEQVYAAIKALSASRTVIRQVVLSKPCRDAGFFLAPTCEICYNIPMSKNLRPKGGGERASNC